MIRKKIQTLAFSFLMSKKETHSKMSENQYDKLETQSYLKSDSGLTDKQKQLLTIFCTRMYKVRNKYKNLNENKLCQLCKSENEDQIHLFNCDKLLRNCEELANNVEIEYEDLFGSKEKMLEAVKLLEKIVETREKLIEETQ